MLNVYLIRWFTIDLLEHVARSRGGLTAVPLPPKLRRFLGIGNATGLGMAPFLVNHPLLIQNWVAARETALARVRSLESVSSKTLEKFSESMNRAKEHVEDWKVGDELQMERIQRLLKELEALRHWFGKKPNMKLRRPWGRLFRYAESNFSLEGQEMTVSLLLEPHGKLVDDLSDWMHSSQVLRLEPAMSVGRLKRLIENVYDWALEIYFDDPEAQQHFWYYSEEKLEPRFGTRDLEPGSELEMPLAIGRDISELYRELLKAPEHRSAGEFVMTHPGFRHMVRRVQALAEHPYAEIRDNLVGSGVRPIDLLRFKLAFFGATKFDPKSDLWIRITMFQGAPLPDELEECDLDDWAFPVRPVLSYEPTFTDAVAE